MCLYTLFTIQQLEPVINKLQQRKRKASRPLSYHLNETSDLDHSSSFIFILKHFPHNEWNTESDAIFFQPAWLFFYLTVIPSCLRRPLTCAHVIFSLHWDETCLIDRWRCRFRYVCVVSWIHYLFLRVCPQVSSPSAPVRLTK